MRNRSDVVRDLLYWADYFELPKPFRQEVIHLIQWLKAEEEEQRAQDEAEKHVPYFSEDFNPNH